MSAIDNSEVTHARDDEVGINLTRVINPETRKERRVLHFSDGTLEESDSESEERMLGAASTSTETDSKTSPAPVIDPKTLSWPSWIWYQGSQGGTKTLNFMDYLGESFAYYLGITSSKYQYEIDEFHRMKQEEEMRANSNNVELASWSSPSTSRPGDNQVAPKPEPIVTEILSSNPDIVV